MQEWFERLGAGVGWGHFRATNRAHRVQWASRGRNNKATDSGHCVCGCIVNTACCLRYCLLPAGGFHAGPQPRRPGCIAVQLPSRHCRVSRAVQPAALAHHGELLLLLTHTQEHDRSSQSCATCAVCKTTHIKLCHYAYSHSGGVASRHALALRPRLCFLLCAYAAAVMLHTALATAAVTGMNDPVIPVNVPGSAAASAVAGAAANLMRSCLSAVRRSHLWVPPPAAPLRRCLTWAVRVG